MSTGIFTGARMFRVPLKQDVDLGTHLGMRTIVRSRPFLLKSQIVNPCSIFKIIFTGSKVAATKLQV